MKKFKNKFNALKLRTKILVLLLVVGLVPLAVLGSSLSISAHDTVVKNRQADMQNSLEQVCIGVTSQIEVCEQLMDYFVHDQNVINFLECSSDEKSKRYGFYQEVGNTITALEYQNTMMRSITIYSDNITQSYGKETQPLSKFKMSQWYAKMDLKAGHNQIYDSETLEVISIEKIPSYSGIESYVVVRSSTNDMMSSLQQLATDDYGVHVIGEEEVWNYNGDMCVDENGRFLNFDENRNADDYLWVEADIDDLQMHVIYFTPQIAITTLSTENMLVIVLLIGLCFALILILGRFFANYLSRPLELLTKDIQAIDSENMTTDVTTERADEIGILIQSYGHMIQRIQELIQENYETKIAQKEFEMKALQAQINPHFLYNSLSIINWKAIEADEQEISQITLALSSFYRTTLNRGNTMNTIRNAIENIQSYLKIQQCMHDDNFQVHYDIDEETYDYYIPLLIFQPFVENAIEHGLDMKEDPDHQMWINVYKEDKDIVITIADNGVGIPEAEMSDILDYDTKGYGVKNVNDRMKLHYGDDYQIQVESKENEGTKLTLHFPKEQEE